MLVCKFGVVLGTLCYNSFKINNIIKQFMRLIHDADERENKEMCAIKRYNYQTTLEAVINWWNDESSYWSCWPVHIIHPYYTKAKTYGRGVSSLMFVFHTFFYLDSSAITLESIIMLMTIHHRLLCHHHQCACAIKISVSCIFYLSCLHQMG